MERRIRFLGFELVFYFEREWKQIFTSAYGYFRDIRTLSVWAGPFGVYLRRCSRASQQA